jgi:hypothetical protein
MLRKGSDLDKHIRQLKLAAYERNKSMSTQTTKARTHNTACDIDWEWCDTCERHSSVVHTTTIRNGTDGRDRMLVMMSCAHHVAVTL